MKQSSCLLFLLCSTIPLALTAAESIEQIKQKNSISSITTIYDSECEEVTASGNIGPGEKYFSLTKSTITDCYQVISTIKEEPTTHNVPFEKITSVSTKKPISAIKLREIYGDFVEPFIKEIAQYEIETGIVPQ